MTWRRAKQVAVIGLSGAAVFFLISKRKELLSSLHLLTHPDLPWLGAAVVAEALSLLAMAREEWLFLQPGDVDVPTLTMAELTAAHNAITMSVPGGVAWSTAFLFDQLRRRGADRTLAGWTILASGGVSSFTLFLLLATGVELADRGPTTGAKIPVALLAAIPPVAGVVAGILRHRGVRYEDFIGWTEDRTRRWPRVQAWVRRGSQRLRRYRPSVWEWLRGFALSLANWLLDMACLILCLRALDLRAPWPGVLLAYGLSKVVGMLPITPGGLGVVEAGLTGLLAVYGLSPGRALVATLLYRLISFWALLPIGWGYWGFLKLRQRTAGSGLPAS